MLNLLLSNALYMHTLYVFWYNGPFHVLTVHFPLMRVVQGVSNSASNVIKTLDNDLLDTTLCPCRGSKYKIPNIQGVRFGLSPAGGVQLNKWNGPI